MPQGTVKILVDDRGYGFIAPADGGADVFFPHSACPSHGFRKLTVGQSVNYEIQGGDKKSAKGPRARNVVPAADTE